MSHITRITRRDFLQAIGVGAGGLLLGCSLSPVLSNLVRDGFPMNAFVAIKGNGDIIIIVHRSEMGQGIRSSLAAVLADELEADWARVTLRQADADAHSFGVPSPYPIGPLTEIVPNESAQATENSWSMSLYFSPMRIFGAAIRLIMIRAAALRYEVDPDELHARQHRVWHDKSGRSIDYRFLLLQAKRVMLPSYDEILAALKPPLEWRFIGGSMPFYDAPQMVSGKAVYCGDIHLPGMLTASIERCPVANGRLVSFDSASALAVPGVRKVLPTVALGAAGGGVGRAFIPHAGVAVLATNTWAAIKGRQALAPTIKWDLGPNASFDSEKFRKELELSTARPGRTARRKGDVDAAFSTAVTVIEASYYVPHLAQAPMEPPVAIARFADGRMEVWAPTQNPDTAQQAVGQIAFNIPEALWNDQPTKEEIRNRVTLHVTLLGGSFGRKSSPDFVVEAAVLAKQLPGVPIRVLWTREDDLRFSYYNSASSQYLKAGLDGDGHAIGLLQRGAFASILSTFFPPPSTPNLTDDQIDRSAKARATFDHGGEYPYGSAIERAQGLEDMPFDMPNLRIENCPAENHIRIGCMRSAANIYHAFGICSFADELAVAARRDSKDYLLELLGKGRILSLDNEGVEWFRNNELPLLPIELPISRGRSIMIMPGYPVDTRRLRAVVERVARESGWDEKVRQYGRAKGRGLGIAAHRSRLSYVAVVIDVSLNEANELTINEIYGAIDCGLAVNPDRIYAQMEGGILYGLSLALFGEITIKKGAVVQHDFDDHRVLRMNQTPRRLSMHIIDSSEPPTGAGEPPVPVVAPALANAIAAAGGPRIREIPFSKKVVL